MSAFFITGTGTGIGKTFVTAGLLRVLRPQGASAIKPVLSGYDSAPGSDPALLLEAMGHAVSEKAVAAIAPFRFAAPLSPDMAASREGRAIDFAAALSFCRQAAARPETVLIEGVGGVMVPLDDRHTTLDLMAALNLPVLLVAGSYLGSISHSLTAMAALAQAGITPALVIVNDSGTGEVPLAETAETLGRFLPGQAIATLPRPAQETDFVPVAGLLLGKRETAA
ncbi:MAG: dethiobiotin synthase [Rhizomicrobium sp.]|nr:dethiobiotin synthase [Rhizomicrobium sp.]